MIINMTNQSDWFNTNLLRRSIAWMKDNNVGGRFDIAIEREELLLSSFWNALKKEQEVVSQQEAA